MFREMSSDIPENVAKHSGECCQKIREMSPNILVNVVKHFGECPQIFGRMLPSIPGNVAEHSEECTHTFHGISVTQGNEGAGSVQDFMAFVVQESVVA